jgi:hypothetical protein
LNGKGFKTGGKDYTVRKQVLSHSSLLFTFFCQLSGCQNIRNQWP